MPKKYTVFFKTIGRSWFLILVIAIVILAFFSPIAAVWMLVAMIIAVRQALDYNSTLRAIGVCSIGWIIQIALFILLIYISGGFPR